MSGWTETVSDHPHQPWFMPPASLGPREWNRRDIRPRRRTRRHQRSQATCIHVGPKAVNILQTSLRPVLRLQNSPAQGSFERKAFISLITSASFDLKT
jgi:hypothetical protein